MRDMLKKGQAGGIARAKSSQSEALSRYAVCEYALHVHICHIRELANFLHQQRLRRSMHWRTLFPCVQTITGNMTIKFSNFRTGAVGWNGYLQTIQGSCPSR